MIGPADPSPEDSTPEDSTPEDSPSADPATDTSTLDLPGTPDSEGWRKLHPLSPILRGGISFLLLIGLIIVNLRDRLVRFFVGGEDAAEDDTGDVISLYEFLTKNGYLLIAIGAIVALILLVVLFSWIGWRFRTYRIANDTVEARSGVIFRQHRRAPLDRVQSVNLQRTLLARLIGLTKVEVLTGGQGGKVELTYLGHRDAKSVREHILSLAASSRGGAPSRGGVRMTAPEGHRAEEHSAEEGPAHLDGTTYPTAADPLAERAQDFVDLDIDPEAKESNALVRVPVGRLLGSIALGWEVTVTLLLVLIALSWGVIAVVLGSIGGSASLLFSGGVPLLTIVPLIIAMIAVLFSQFNKGFNFTLSRGRDSVRVGSGLTSTTTDSIPFGRIHAIEARQPLFWRPFGWWRVRVTVAGHSLIDGGQSATQNLVLPVGPISDAVRVIDTLLPGAADGLRDGMIGSGEGYTKAGPRAGWVLWFAKRRAGIRIDVPEEPSEAGNATLRIRRGYLTRSLVIMPIVRAQSVQLRRPMVHYWLGLASLQAHTVMGPVIVQMRGLELGDARRIFHSLAATVLEVQRDESDARATARSENSAETLVEHLDQPQDGVNDELPAG